MKRVTVIFLALLLVSVSVYAKQLTPVKVQLQWKYQFQFAGFIMAKELGYYRDAGLDVTLLEYNGGDIKQSIEQKNVDFFMQNSALLFDKHHHLLPVKLLATYFQRSPLVLVVQHDIDTVPELKGKKIMTGGNEVDDTSLDTLLKQFGINPTNTTFLPHSFNLQDFIEKKVDAMSVFRTDQLYELKQKHILYHIIDPAQYGLSTNANNLFATRDYVKHHPHEVEAFVLATKKGWEYALSHIKESAKVIYEKYSKHKTLDALIYEGKTTKQLMLANLYDVGTINVKNIFLMYEEYKKTHGVMVVDDALRDYIYHLPLTPASLSKEQKSYLAHHKKVRVCVDPNWKPYEWIDEKGKYRGMGSEYLHLFTESLGFKIILYRTKNWSETLEAIKTKRCDFIPMIGITKQRKEFLNFTDSYLFTPYAIVTTNDKSFISDIATKLDKTYSVIKDSAVIDMLQNRYGKMNFTKVSTIDEGMSLVRDGKVFGFINTAPVISYYIQEHQLNNMKIDGVLHLGYQLAMATRKDEKILHEILSKAIQYSDSKKIENIYQKWQTVLLEQRQDYTLIYKTLGVVGIIILALLYRWMVLRDANSSLTEKVKQKTQELQKLNTHLESIVEQRTKELEYQAHYDLLTGLPNRRLFELQLHEALTEAIKSQHNMALFFIDVDQFKQINDYLGHKVGDGVLQEVTKLIQSMIMEDSCLLARIGGDEFTLIVEQFEKEDECRVIAQRLLEIAKEPIQVQNQTLYVSLSIGIALAPKDTIAESELLQFADAAMYRAKMDGRNRYQFYDKEMSEKAYERVVLQTKLRHAIDNDEFEVYFQPQVDIVSRKIIGCEALVRWRDTKRGIIPPGEFIPIAEESGLVVEIDTIVMQKAIAQVAKWHKEGKCKGHISINLAAKQLRDDDLIVKVQGLLEQYSFDPKYLELEITESDIMHKPEEALKRLNALHEMGIKIAIDDFGTGYSSLSYLKRFPIDKLKIDQSFVRDVVDDEEDRSIVKAVIALGQSLGIALIAEGVETKEQEAFLLENGCTQVQGYLYAKPLCMEDTEDFIQDFC